VGTAVGDRVVGPGFPLHEALFPRETHEKPELRGKDLETTKRACEKFEYTPVAVFNFMEGTRFTPEKHAQQPSPYRHLLKPRAGGTGFVLGAMGTKLQTMLDVTIVYPDGVGGIWDYLSGRIRRVVVHIDQKTIPPVFLGCNYNEDREFRINFQKWVTALWEEKRPADRVTLRPLLLTHKTPPKRGFLWSNN